MKEVVILILLCCVIFTFVRYDRNNYREACEAQGGEPLFGTYQEFCVQKGSVIELK